jgi:aspartate-semialdehyde dehydrogenase
MAQKIPVGILGATGTVGQRFIRLLEHHPWFEVAWLAASDRSAGQPYAQAARWNLDTPIPPRIAAMTVSPALPESAPRVLFASVDAPVAQELEPRFAAAGCAVISNSSAFRLHPDVPLVIPEVNAGHLALLERQEWRRRSGGFLVTNSNCSVMGLVMALAPLQDFGVEQVIAVTMQAVSGAGYPGVPSLDVLGNVIPYIPREEEKMEAEARKMLGRLQDGRLVEAALAVSAHCNRVPVLDGHTESVSFRLRRKATQEEVLAAWSAFNARNQITGLGLPSAPGEFLRYDPRADRPQPRLDASAGNGMTAVIGRLRPCSVLDWKCTVLSHNVIRGAAGAAILNAELLRVKGYLDR